MSRLFTRALLLAALAASPCLARAEGATPARTGGSSGAVHVQSQNTSIQVLEDVALGVKYFVGWMMPQPRQVVSLDDKNSYTVRIDQAETHLDAKGLSRLLNEYLLPLARSSLKNVVITFAGQTLLIKGDLHKGIDLPFEATGAVGITAAGDIRIHLTEMKAAGMLKKGLLDLMGLNLASIAQPRRQAAFRIEGDDIILPVAQMFPPPHISGRLTAIRIAGDELVQVFGVADPQLTPPPDKVPEYIYFRGGTMSFGKMTMKDVDLQLVDKSPSAVLEFSFDHYYRQLEAGYSQTLPNRGLLVTIPNYSTVRRH